MLETQSVNQSGISQYLNTTSNTQKMEYKYSPRDSQESSPTPQFKSINSSVFSLLYGSTLTFVHDYQKNHTLTIQTFVGKVMFVFFNMLSRFVTAFLPRTKRLLISWLQSPSAVILEPKKIKSVTVPIVSLSICHEVMGPDVMILVFSVLSFKCIYVCLNNFATCIFFIQTISL